MLQATEDELGIGVLPTEKLVLDILISGLSISGIMASSRSHVMDMVQP